MSKRQSTTGTLLQQGLSKKKRQTGRKEVCKQLTWRPSKKMVQRQIY